MIYTTEEFFDRYLRGEFRGRDLWLRDLFGEPNWSGRPWRIWQYNCRGRVDGIQGPVDLNAFNGSEEEYRAWSSP
jgi:lysozyme